MLAHTNKNFQIYPTNRVVGVIDSRRDADDTVSDLIKVGFTDSLIDESIGLDGMVFLDPDGINHGFINNMIRKWQNLGQGEEKNYLDRVRKNLKEGHVIVSVPALTIDARNKVSEIMHMHHASDIRYYGRMHVEDLN
jgi:hypothetical protein